MRSKQSARAFAPGHTTGIFEIRDKHDDLLKKGSRGSGICLSKGAITTATVEPSEKQDISVSINGELSAAPVSRMVVRTIVGSANLSVRINTMLELPMGQGFGMSSAGALSTAFALAHAVRLNCSYWQIVGIAHVAEVANRTGLGDVVAASTGGITLRRKEGVPPYGFVDSIVDEKRGERDIQLCVVGVKIPTKGVLSDAQKRARIMEVGHKGMRALEASPTLECMFALSRKFAIETGLIAPEVKEAVDEACIEGSATMSMLGNSVFATGVEPKRMRKHGLVIECKVDYGGARILQ